MDEIRPWLYVGNYNDTFDRDGLDSRSIQVMLQLAAPINQIGITSLYLPVEDTEPIPPGLLKEGMEFVINEKNKGHKILIACAVGRNRSVTFCIAALREVEGLSLLDAFKDIKKKHSISLPQKMIWKSLCSYYNEEISYLDMLRAAA